MVKFENRAREKDGDPLLEPEINKNELKTFRSNFSPKKENKSQFPSKIPKVDKKIEHTKANYFMPFSIGNIQTSRFSN